MNDQDLKKLFGPLLSESAVKLNEEKIQTELPQQLSRFDEIVEKRNKWEILTAVLLMPVFLLIGIFVHPLLSRIGALLVIPYCVFVIYMIKKTRQGRVTDVTLSSIEYLRSYRTYLEKERKLLANVGAWHVAPCIFCMCLFFIGLGKAALALSSVGMGVVVVYLNKKEIRRSLQPLLNHLTAEIAQFEEKE